MVVYNAQRWFVCRYMVWRDDPPGDELNWLASWASAHRRLLCGSKYLLGIRGVPVADVPVPRATTVGRLFTGGW